ncbi:hypothetical protein JHK82_042039 [Glycine max]|uniref:Uncharacterized protein n=2 Tax=Glycine subgen. Soja TaxID=1462606 RepID=K7MAU9_SOYBN|nr:hypothetical protein JHK87_041995 [Glycine soja]KAG4948853.1 hypothetical protein JHK86_042092 [Glycine max]KAG4956332.1 hypothetical protein JHK85_042712 [Glycine max]KAG5105069.1 hypothetical protein JHK82_042039 [Glycine max]KAG5116194.1 hypothetical protein JHK84_042307 [Glycine max]
MTETPKGYHNNRPVSFCNRIDIATATMAHSRSRVHFFAETLPLVHVASPQEHQYQLTNVFDWDHYENTNKSLPTTNSRLFKSQNQKPFSQHQRLIS